jgi:molybdate transport system ATP-binding protein
MSAVGTLADITSRPDLIAVAQPLGPGSVVATTVEEIDQNRRLAHLAFAGGALQVPAAGLEIGASVRVRVPAREVILATLPPQGLSLHNVLAGHVGMIGPAGADQVIVQVVVGETRFLAQVTSDAIERLSLRAGVPVFALVKSVSIEMHGQQRADTASDNRGTGRRERTQIETLR